MPAWDGTWTKSPTGLSGVSDCAWLLPSPGPITLGQATLDPAASYVALVDCVWIMQLACVDPRGGDPIVIWRGTRDFTAPGDTAGGCYVRSSGCDTTTEICIDLPSSSSSESPRPPLTSESSSSSASSESSSSSESYSSLSISESLPSLSSGSSFGACCDELTNDSNISSVDCAFDAGFISGDCNSVTAAIVNAGGPAAKIVLDVNVPCNPDGSGGIGGAAAIACHNGEWLAKWAMCGQEGYVSVPQVCADGCTTLTVEWTAQANPHPCEVCVPGVTVTVTIVLGTCGSSSSSESSSSLSTPSGSGGNGGSPFSSDSGTPFSE